MGSSISSRLSDVVSALLVDASECDRASIAPHLRAYPTQLLERLVAVASRVRPLADGERYRDVSREGAPLRAGHLSGSVRPRAPPPCVRG